MIRVVPGVPYFEKSPYGYPNDVCIIAMYCMIWLWYDTPVAAPLLHLARPKMVNLWYPLVNNGCSSTTWYWLWTPASSLLLMFHNFDVFCCSFFVPVTTKEQTWLPWSVCGWQLETTIAIWDLSKNVPPKLVAIGLWVMDKPIWRHHPQTSPRFNKVIHCVILCPA